MTPERWQKTKDVLATALELFPEERSVYLERSCAGDGGLRRDVERLLRLEPEMSSRFLSQPDLVDAALALLPEESSRWIRFPSRSEPGAWARCIAPSAPTINTVSRWR
jgi:hypothetical protein